MCKRGKVILKQLRKKKIKEVKLLIFFFFNKVTFWAVKCH